MNHSKKFIRLLNRPSADSRPLTQKERVPSEDGGKFYGSVFSDSKREAITSRFYFRRLDCINLLLGEVLRHRFSGIESCAAARNRSDDDLDKSGLPSDWATPRL
ncbi:hypothetical protein CEXT_512371 [Caerostris extrusa]|uniref:Uncharacterized protein n=1 Tax=Caerostris extrusa TaxID=172846 RepID=A0AAV4TES1_CAEEX|nr:hypothetical protein CEXT_512371 [Caerostris extrusa]